MYFYAFVNKLNIDLNRPEIKKCLENKSTNGYGNYLNTCL